MANIQQQFNKFHDKIKLTEENEELRDKREIILQLLRNRLSELFKARNEKVPVFEEFNQGSYAMNTGTVPINCDYDIDVGLRFKLPKDAYPDPVKIKQWICDALNGHTKREVEIKEPCVRIIFSLDNEPEFHVDLAIYSSSDVNQDNKTYLARGKSDSEPKERIWEESEPQQLLDIVNNNFSGKDKEQQREQFHRVIRYMKRWKDLNFSPDGHSSPIGIGITLAALKYFIPNVTVNSFTNVAQADDLSALIQWVGNMINDFQQTQIANGETQERLYIEFPVAPYNEVFSKMTDAQMIVFKEKLQYLKSELELAQSEPDPHEACKRLSVEDVFGKDFPVPSKEETGEPRRRAYISSGQSGYAA